MSSALADVSPERLRMFLINALPYRELVVSISPADERRLRRNIAAYNRETTDGDHLDAECPTDLAVVFTGCALRGLEAADDDDGVWSDLDGHAYDLPRPHRSPLRLRVRFAWRAARQTWRSS